MPIQGRLVDQAAFVTGLAPITPSSSTPDYVTMKGWNNLAVIITVDNGNTVTGSAITLKQATAVAGTGEKALSFDTMYANEDTGAGDTLTETAVASDTFTTDDTNAKNLIYVIEVDVQDLDIDNGFDCVRAGTGNGTNTVLSVNYVLYNGRHEKLPAATVITD